MIEKMIVDADLCIKLGGSSKYKYLYDILPLVSKRIYMHTQAHSEVMMSAASVSQLRALVSEGEVNISRKVAKTLWLVAGKKKETFDTDIWPIQ